MDVVVHKPRMMAQRTALCNRFQIRLARVTVLDVGKLIAQRGHDLSQHDAGIGFDLLRPLGIALRGKVKQRVAHADEVARQVVDGEVNELLRRAFKRPWLAVEIAGAALLERELDTVEEAIESPLPLTGGLFWLIYDRQTIDRKVAWLGCLHLQYSSHL